MKPVNIATKILAACCALICLSSTMMPMGGPAGSPMGMPPMGGPAGSPMGMPPMGGPGGMPAPSQADIEDAFAKVEEIQKNDPKLFEQLENAGKEIIRELAKQDPAQLEEFAKSFGLKPEELLREAEKPSTPEPVLQTPIAEPEEEGPAVEEEEAEEPKQPARPAHTEPVKTEVPTGKKPIPVDEGRVRRTIAAVAEHIESLRNKMASSGTIAGEFGSLELDLLSLALLITSIDSPEHTSRLSSGEYAELITALEKLAAVLVAQEPLIQAFKPSQTPYDLLGVSPHVTQKQLDKVFKELKKRLDPKVVEKKLQKSGLTGDDLKRQVKAAKITFSEVEEAYDLISDPITRRDIVDRAIELEAKQSGIDLTTSKAAIAEVREALSDALYKDEVISKIEAYLEKYAPEELKQKKAREKDEKKRLEEQKKRARQSPVLTPGESFEPTINVPSAMTGGYNTGYPSPVWSPESPATRYQQTYPDYTAPNLNQPPATPTDVTKSKGDETTKKTEPLTAGEKEAKKIDIRSVKEIVNSLDKKLKEFAQAYDDETNQKTVKKLLTDETPAIRKLEKEVLDLGRKATEMAEKRAEKKTAEQKEEEKTKTEPEKKVEEKKEPVKTEPAKTEPEKAEPVKTEPVTTEPAKTEPVKTEPVKTEKVLSQTEEDALFKQTEQKAQNIGAEIQQKTEQFNSSVDKLRTNLKLDDFSKELDTLSRVVSKLRAKTATEDQALAWDKFREHYEKSETPPAPETDPTKPAAETKKPKVKPAPKQKLETFHKTIREAIKQANFEKLELSALTDLDKLISKDIPANIRKIDTFFARVQTAEQKSTEQPKQQPATETKTTGSTGGSEKK